MTKTYASPRESRVAMSQHHSVPLAEAEFRMSLDKTPETCISGEKGSSYVPDKIMLLGALGFCLRASSPYEDQIS